MRIITFNVNGIRSAVRKGLLEWLRVQRADIVCLQEVRAGLEDIEAIRFPRVFHRFAMPAEKPGYSGVMILSRHAPDEVHHGLGVAEFDAEGRYLALRFGRLAVASVYFPSGSAGEHRQAAKYRFLDHFSVHLDALRRAAHPYILCGDWNIAHRPIDLRNWRANQRNSGFLPEERAWLDGVFDGQGWVDAFRAVNPHPDQYTWWSNRGRARDNNVGWRIDYQVISPGLRAGVQRAAIYKARWFSDHAPLTIDYRIGVDGDGHA